MSSALCVFHLLDLTHRVLKSHKLFNQMTLLTVKGKKLQHRHFEWVQLDLFLEFDGFVFLYFLSSFFQNKGEV